jgi:hypothetical protein
MPRERDPQSKWPQRAPTTGMRLEDEVVTALKHYAIDNRQTMGEVVNELLREFLTKKGYLKKQ